MFGPAGSLYVYFTYGMHYCCNVVTGKGGEGSAVLIRAIEPIEGIDVMETYRSKSGRQLTNGPAKWAQAFAINASHNGSNLIDSDIRLIEQPALRDASIVQTPRIGISKAIDTKWRFYIKDNEWVSK
jgi:DNA-3-methyladenine glycosylase